MNESDSKDPKVKPNWGFHTFEISVDFVDTLVFLSFSMQVVNTHTPGKKVWLGGLGPAWAGGISNLSDTYAAGFL